MKYTITHYRKHPHTHEEFIKWIVEKHLPLAMPIFKKHGILGYSLVSTLYRDFAFSIELT
jgi:hypothetical protein